MKEAAVDIRPGVSVLSVLRHLNYSPWYALAEFVDNSVDSFLKHRKKLEELHGDDFKLVVRIDLDAGPPARIRISDNAAGIAVGEYGRAFRPAAVPIDRSGLSEFGMGMKSAACWFAPRWSVRTCALGENVEKLVRFDIEKIVHDEIEELVIEQSEALPETHFTEVVLDAPFRLPKGRTIGKLKDHLASIYRAFLRENVLDLRLNGRSLTFEEPVVLSASFFKTPDSDSVLWRKEIDFDFGDGLSVKGFAALRKTAIASGAGFSLFRRNRVVQGSGDEGYLPPEIFGAGNSYRFQRLFGELHLSGFDVSHTKDGFKWDENEGPFLDILKEHLNAGELPLLRQAEGFRVRAAKQKLQSAANEVIKNLTRAIAAVPEIANELISSGPVEVSDAAPLVIESIANRTLDVNFREVVWRIHVELTNDPAESQWLFISDRPGMSDSPRKLELRVSLAHPFMVQFAQNNRESMEALVRVAAALGISEVLAREAGVRKAGTVIRNLNELLAPAFSAP
jgi:hypothetical protein